MTARNGRSDGTDPTTFGDPAPGTENFFGIDPGNSSTGAEGTATPAPPASVPDVQQEVHDPSRPSTVFNGQLDGLVALGVSQQDVTDAGGPGGHPRAPQHGPDVAYTIPSSNNDGLGWRTGHRPVGSEDGTSFGDPFIDSFGVGGHSFGAVERPDTSGHGNTADDSGAGHGSAGHNS